MDINEYQSSIRNFVTYPKEIGVFYNILLILLLILGGYLIIKREWPNFFTTKMLGFYLFMIGILSLMHEEYIAANNYNGIKVFQETVDQLTIAFSSLTNSSATPDIIGGGIIGCTFSVLFTSLFSYNGMKNDKENIGSFNGISNTRNRSFCR